MARLCHYVADHQSDWADFVQPLTYANKLQLHRSMGTTRFDLVLSRYPFCIVVQSGPENRRATETQSKAQLKKKSLTRVHKSIAVASMMMMAAQEQYKTYFDHMVKTLNKMDAGDNVFLYVPPNGARPTPKYHRDDQLGAKQINSKVLPKSTGPYMFISMDDHTVAVLQDGLENIVAVDRVTKAFQLEAPPTGV